MTLTKFISSCCANYAILHDCISYVNEHDFFRHLMTVKDDNSYPLVSLLSMSLSIEGQFEIGVAGGGLNLIMISFQEIPTRERPWRILCHHGPAYVCRVSDYCYICWTSVPTCYWPSTISSMEILIGLPGHSHSSCYHSYHS